MQPCSVSFAPWDDRLLMFCEESGSLHLRRVPTAAEAGALQRDAAKGGGEDEDGGEGGGQLPQALDQVFSDGGWRAVGWRGAAASAAAAASALPLLLRKPQPGPPHIAALSRITPASLPASTQTWLTRGPACSCCACPACRAPRPPPSVRPAGQEPCMQRTRKPRPLAAVGPPAGQLTAARPPCCAHSLTLAAGPLAAAALVGNRRRRVTGLAVTSAGDVLVTTAAQVGGRTGCWAGLGWHSGAVNSPSSPAAASNSSCLTNAGCLPPLLPRMH